VKNAVHVTILGQQYTVKSEVDPAEVARVAAFVNEQLAEATSASRAGDTLNAAVLALMNVAGAYLQLRDQEGRRRQETEAYLSRLLDRLDRQCPSSSDPGASRSRDGRG
jgi:cell division protein ZapA